MHPSHNNLLPISSKDYYLQDSRINRSISEMNFFALLTAVLASSKSARMYAPRDIQIASQYRSYHYAFFSDIAEYWRRPHR